MTRLRWRITWRLMVWRKFGIIWCRDCHHRWGRHHAHGYRINHPLDPEDWTVEYNCDGCEEGWGNYCTLVMEKDELGELSRR